MIYVRIIIKHVVKTYENSMRSLEKDFMKKVNYLAHLVDYD